MADLELRFKKVGYKNKQTSRNKCVCCLELLVEFVGFGYNVRINICHFSDLKTTFQYYQQFQNIIFAYKPIEIREETQSFYFRCGVLKISPTQTTLIQKRRADYVWNSTKWEPANLTVFSSCFPFLSFVLFFLFNTNLFFKLIR